MESYDQPRQHTKSTDITLSTNVCLVKAMIFPLVMYGCENWTVKKAEHRNIDALNCGVGEDSWESLGYKEIKPVNPKENQPWTLIGRTDTETEDLILWRSDVKSWLLEKTLKLGKTEGRRGQQKMRWWMASLPRWTWFWASSRSWWWAGKSGVLQSVGSQRGGHDWVTELIILSLSHLSLLGFSIIFWNMKLFD